MSSRRGFLKQAAGATLVVAGAGTGAALIPSAAEAGTFIPGKCSFEVDGVNWGKLYSAYGGDPQFAVVNGIGADGSPDKILGPPTWSPVTIGVGAGMAPEMYEWIKASFDRRAPILVRAAIIACDSTGLEIGRRWLTNATMVSFTTPRLLSTPQSLPAMTLTLSVDSAYDDFTENGTPVRAPAHTPWLCNGFKFDCPGISGRIASVDSFTWKRPLPPGAAATVHDRDNDVACTLGQNAVASWRQWYDNFALGGDASDERSAILSVWGSTHSAARFAWSFGGLGIISLAPRGGVTNPGSNVGMVAEMYCQRALWGIGGNVSFS